MRKFIAVSVLAGLTLLGSAACTETKHASGHAAAEQAITMPTGTATASTEPSSTPTPAVDPTTDEPSPTPDDSVFGLKPGTPLNIESTSDPVGTATVAADHPVVVTPGMYDDAPAGEYIGIKITMRVESGRFDINPFDFALRADAGQTIDTAFVMNDAFPELHAGTERAGRAISGYLLFDLPHGFSGELSYEPGLDSLGSWVIHVA